MRAAGGEALALSSAQLGIWFAQKLDSDSAAYNIGEYIEIEGAVVLPLFERALRQVVAEAQSLRLRFVGAGRRAAAMGRRAGGFPLPIVDVSVAADPRAAAETWMKADLARPVDPTAGPLFGFAMFKASSERFFWYARYHHLVLDGYGMWLIARRVAEVYSGLCAGAQPQGEVFGPLSALLEGRRLPGVSVVRGRSAILERGAEGAARAGQPDAEQPAVDPLAELFAGNAGPAALHARTGCGRWRRAAGPALPAS